MKDVYELSDYELLYALIANKLKAKNNNYCLYETTYIWDLLRGKYRDLFDYDKRKMYAKLYHDESYNLLNHLMEELIHKFSSVGEYLGIYELDYRDMFFYQNFDRLCPIIYDEVAFEYNNYAGLEKCELAPLNKGKTIRIVKDILDELDPNGEWTKVYEDAIDKNKLFYLNELSPEEINKFKEILGFIPKESGIMVFNQTTGEIIGLFLKYEGTIKDVYTTVHEMIHYINRSYDKGFINRSLIEFPSIFYELYTLDYLRKIGYDDLDIDSIRKFRANNVINGYNLIKDVLYYLELYLKNGTITRENDRAKGASKRKRETINALIKNPYIFHQVYPYILDTYLANQGINMLNNGDKTVLDMMKYITVNLSKMNDLEMFNLFDSKVKCKIREKV